MAQRQLLLVQEIHAENLESASLGDLLMRFEGLRAWWAFYLRMQKHKAEPAEAGAPLTGLLA